MEAARLHGQLEDVELVEGLCMGFGGGEGFLPLSPRPCSGRRELTGGYLILGLDSYNIQASGGAGLDTVASVGVLEGVGGDGRGILQMGLAHGPTRGT